jgi:hypothetical protein
VIFRLDIDLSHPDIDDSFDLAIALHDIAGRIATGYALDMPWLLEVRSGAGNRVGTMQIDS